MKKIHIHFLWQIFHSSFSVIPFTQSIESMCDPWPLLTVMHLRNKWDKKNCNFVLEWAGDDRIILVSVALTKALQTASSSHRVRAEWAIKTCPLAFPDGSTSLADSLDNDKLPNANEQPATAQQQVSKTAPLSAGGGEVKLRERRRRESAPVIGVLDPDQAQSACSQQVRGARRVSKGSQRAMLVSCLSEDSALEGLESVGEIQTPKGSRRNFIELMMSSSPQVGRFTLNW